MKSRIRSAVNDVTYSIGEIGGLELTYMAVLIIDKKITVKSVLAGELALS